MANSTYEHKYSIGDTVRDRVGRIFIWERTLATIDNRPTYQIMRWNQDGFLRGSLVGEIDMISTRAILTEVVIEQRMAPYSIKPYKGLYPANVH